MKPTSPFARITLGALIGALACGLVVGYFMFAVAGPDYARTSTDNSVKGMWPIVAFFGTVVAAGLGAALGAVIAGVACFVRGRRK